MIKNEIINMMDGDSRSIHYSCRLDTEIYRFLADEAGQKSISMNNLLNHMTREYVMKKNFEKIGSVLMCKDVARGVFDMANDKQLIKLAEKLGSNNAVDYVGMLYHDIDKDAILQFLDLWGRRFHGYEHKNDDNVHSFSIPHDINEKYSIFMKKFITSFVESTINESTKVQSTSRVVTFSIMK
ncbi:MAG TPA: hypothetical protein VFX64_01950 [Candidatus Nitrosotalea sp.]|nr:hypothetical protein [Candidatus Nitrosotalea sp.]